MSPIDQEAKICVSCGNDFMPQTMQAIPICPECELEERETTQTAKIQLKDLEGEVNEETQTQITVTPEISQESAEKVNHQQGWKIQKTDDQVYGPYPTKTIALWSSQGKILPKEKVCRLHAKGQGDWEVISQSATFSHLIDASSPVKYSSTNTCSLACP